MIVSLPFTQGKCAAAFGHIIGTELSMRHFVVSRCTLNMTSIITCHTYFRFISSLRMNMDTAVIYEIVF